MCCISLFLQHIPVVGSIFGDSFYDQQLASRQTNALSHQVTERTNDQQTVVFFSNIFSNSTLQFFAFSSSSSTWLKAPLAPPAFTTSVPPSTTHRQPWWASLEAACRTRSNSVTVTMATSPTSSLQVHTLPLDVLSPHYTLAAHLVWSPSELGGKHSRELCSDCLQDIKQRHSLSSESWIYSNLYSLGFDLYKKLCASDI